MPPLRAAGPLRAALAIAFVCGVLALLAWAWWPSILAVIALVVFVGIAGHRRARCIAAERDGESICGFARSFDRRAVDPWIIRAAYEELSTSFGFPVRAVDHFERDLSVDAEELDFFAMDIAARAGRSLEQAEGNPMFGRFSTVRDLVLFLNHQPSLQQLRTRARGQSSLHDTT